MNEDERGRLVTKYRDGFDAVVKALDGITDDELDRSAEDGWAPRQIVHHLADSAMIGGTRIRFLLAHAPHAHDHAAQIRRARGKG